MIEVFDYEDSNINTIRANQISRSESKKTPSNQGDKWHAEVLPKKEHHLAVIVPPQDLDHLQQE